MKTTELMQDDIVSYNGKPVYVKAILDYDEVMVAEEIDSDKWEKVYAIELEPVELTEQWLLRFGFRKTNRGRYAIPSALWHGTVKSMPGFWLFYGREAVIYLPSVHTLQHVLNDCNYRRKNRIEKK